MGSAGPIIPGLTGIPVGPGALQLPGSGCCRRRSLTGQGKQTPVNSDLLLSKPLPWDVGSKGEDLPPEQKELGSNPGTRFQDIEKVISSVCVCVCVCVSRRTSRVICVYLCVLK